MKTMNVTAKHGNGAVHLGGHDMGNGRWSPACGTQHYNGGGRQVTPLRPTDAEVNCKRCLKVIERDAVNAQPEQAAEIKPDTCGAARYGTGDNTHLCVRVSRHTGDHRTAEGDKFTNWFHEPETPARRQQPHPVGRRLARDHGLNFF